MTYLTLPVLMVALLHLGVRLTDVPAAEGSLVVGEVDQRHLRIRVALDHRAVEADDGFRWRRGGRRRSLLPLEEALDFLKILLDRFLALLQGVDLLLERLQVVGLCEGREARRGR